MNIQCSTDSEVWQAVTAQLEQYRSENFVAILDAKDTPPAVIITADRYDEMWQAILAKCDELQRLPGCRPGMRSTGTLDRDGRHMSAILKVGHNDGTDSVYQVDAYVVTRQPAVEVTVDGPWLDSHDRFWTGQASDRKGAVVIGHTHYRVGPDLDPSRRDLAGHGGRLFRIRRLATGEEFETRNLWYQGVIPPSWRDRLPDDAEFVAAETLAWAAS